MSRDLYLENLQSYIDTFCQRMYFLDMADNPPLVAMVVTSWTKSQPLLTKKLLQYILQSGNRIGDGQEAIAVELAIRNYLLKEFKRDNLTLAIRKVLYQKDLKKIIKTNFDLFDPNIQIYLVDCQKKLGLTDKECKSIQEKYLIYNRNLPLEESEPSRKQLQNNALLAKTNSSNLVSSDSIAIAERLSTTENQPRYQNKAVTKKWLWLLLAIPIILLTIKSLDRFTNFNAVVTNKFNLQQQSLCIDLTSRQSPRMSLGEKFLTKEYGHLKQSSILPFYQGVNAFARCEFATAQQNFQQALTLDKNNPEALIYSNNAKAIASEHLKIAVSVPLGTRSDIAWEMLRGVAQAQAEINRQGGIQNKLLLVQIVNDDNDPQVVRQVASQLVADENILAVVGHNSSNSSLAAADIYQQHQLLMISPTSISTELSGIGSYILRTVPSVAASAAKLANYASANSLTKIALCQDSQDSASSSFARQFRSEIQKNGGEINQIDCDFASSNYQADLAVKSAIASQADAILIASSVKEMDRAIALAKANQQRLPLLGNDSLYTYQTIAQGEEAVAGMVLPSSWLSDASTNNKFSQAALEYWGGKVNWRTAMSYDATKAIIQGLQSSDTRERLQSTLTQPDFLVDGATGKFSFHQGDRLGQIQLAHIERSGDRYRFSQLDDENNL